MGEKSLNDTAFYLFVLTIAGTVEALGKQVMDLQIRVRHLEGLDEEHKRSDDQT